MRIGLDLSFLTHGPRLSQRGVGRYVLQQTVALARHAPEVTVVALCPPGVDLTRAAPALREAPGLETHVLRGIAGHGRRAALNEVTRALRLDGLHFTAPLVEPLEPDLDTAIVATFYDAIPLAYPGAYLAAEGEHAIRFLDAAKRLRLADRVIAISETSRRDATAYFGVPAERTTVAYPIADERFKPLSDAQSDARLERLRGRAGLPRTFVLSVPHLHHSKNMAGLLDAFGRLPRASRAAAPLVIACALDERERLILERMLTARRLATEVTVTGFVSDDELAALYSRALAVIHVSHLEGFGLPALEAMQCGAPIIASRDTATREIVQDAGILVDAESPDDIAAAIQRLLEDPAERARAALAGRERAVVFSAEALAKATAAAYRAAIDAWAFRRSGKFRAPQPSITHRQALAAWLQEYVAKHPGRRAIRLRWDGDPATITARSAGPSDEGPARATVEPSTIGVALFDGGALLNLTRRSFIEANLQACRRLLPEGLVLGTVLLRESGPSDVSLTNLGYPVFTPEELRTWLGDRLRVRRVNTLADLTGWDSVGEAFDPLGSNLQGGRPAVLPDDQTLYLGGVAVGLYAYAIDHAGQAPGWPAAIEARQQQLFVSAHSRWLEALRAEHAYLLSVTTANPPPQWATHLPLWALKLVRQWRRLARLGRAQEAHAVLFQHILQGLGQSSPALIEPDLVVTELDGDFLASQMSDP